jgi:hypothetical protein
MEKRFELLESAVVDIREKVDMIMVETVKNTEQLKEHMRRTAAVEENNKLLKELVQTQRDEMSKKIKPIEQFVDRAKFLGAVAAVAGSLVMGMHKLGFLTFGR